MKPFWYIQPMESVLSQPKIDAIDQQKRATYFLIGILFLYAASVFFVNVIGQWRLGTHTVHNGLYYTFEYNSLVEHVETGKPFNFENARGWRRGPAAYLWMLPIAHLYGKSLSPKIVFSLQLAVVFACIFLSIKIFDFGGPLLLSVPLYSMFWFGAATLQYRIALGDINSLLGFSLFPLLGFYFLTREKLFLPAICFSLASHFRVLSVAELFYLAAKNTKFIWTILITTSILLVLGTLYVSPLQGYLYWIGMARDLLFNGADVRTAFTTWHENIAIPGAVFKIVSGFHFGDKYDLSMPQRTHQIAKIIALVLQLFLFVQILRTILSNKKIFKEFHLTLPAPLKKALLLNEFAFASLLTYVLSPEYGNDFLVTLMPAYLFGAFLYFQGSVSLDNKYWGLYILSVLLTLNIIHHNRLCPFIPFNKFNRWSGNTVGFICYENINVFLIPVIGIVLNGIFLAKARKALIADLTKGAPVLSVKK